MTDQTAAVACAPAPDVVDRLVAAAEALEAIDWHGLAYDLRDIASQLIPGDPKSDEGVEEAAAVVARALAGVPDVTVAARELLAALDEQGEPDDPGTPRTARAIESLRRALGVTTDEPEEGTSC